MKYLKVKWHHSLDNTPVELLSEINSDGWEIRKVEIYSDGKIDFADHEKRSGTTKLGIVPLPSIDDIAENPEFSPEWITAEEFEAAWRVASQQ